MPVLHVETSSEAFSARLKMKKRPVEIDMLAVKAKKNQSLKQSNYATGDLLVKQKKTLKREHIPEKQTSLLHPKKIKILSAKREDEDSFSDNDTEPSQEVTSKVTSFKADVFRRNVFVDAGTELLVFSSILDRGKQDVVKEYFGAGGSASEILDALEECRKASPAHALAALNILQRLFLRTQRDFPLLRADSEDAAMKLLQSSSPFINSLLTEGKRNNANCVALKLLSAMVTLSTQVAREVLSTIVLNKEELRHLTERTVNSKSKSSTRTHFIHFLLSFIVEGNPLTINQLLKKKDLLGTALLGLSHDPARLIHLMLANLETHVLKNPSINKLTKQKTFHTRVLENLILLYDWRGSEVAPSKRYGKYSRRQSKTAQVLPADPEDQKLVHEAVHSFLTLLLTSHKWGIIYSGRGLIARNNNQAFTAIKRLQHPWQNYLKEELLIGVLRACPTYVKPALAVYAEFLTPRPTPMWMEANDFIVKVLSSMTMSDALRGVQNPVGFGSKDLASFVESLALPMSLLHVVLKPGLWHYHAAVREATARLINCVFEQLSRHVQYIEENKLMHSAGINTIKRTIALQLAKIVPVMSIVWHTFDKALEHPTQTRMATSISSDDTDSENESSKCSSDEPSSPDDETAKSNVQIIQKPKVIPLELDSTAPLDIPDDIPEPSKSTLITTLLSLLLGYQNWLPHWVEGSKGAVSVAFLLSNLKEVAASIAQEKGDEAADKLLLQAVCLVSSFDALAIAPSQELFPWTVEVLVKAACNNSEAKSTLERFLMKLNLLQENPRELDLWLWGIKGGDSALKVLVRAILKVARNPIAYSERQFEASFTSGDQSHTKSITAQVEEMLEVLVDELTQYSLPDDLKNMKTPNHGLAFSPLLLAAMEKDSEAIDENKDEVANLLGSVLVRLLFHQAHPEPLSRLVAMSNSSFMPIQASDFVKGWVSRKLILLPEQLVEPEEKQVSDYLCGCEAILPDITNDRPYLLPQLFSLASFHAAQAAGTGTLNQTLAARSWEIMQKVMEVSSPLLTQECLHAVLTHPLLLSAFSLQAKSLSSRLATNLVLQLLEVATTLQDEHFACVASVRQKFLQEITSKLSTDGKNVKFLSWCPEKMTSLVDHLQLNRADLAQILDAACQLPVTSWLHSSEPVLSVPGELAVAMVNRLVELRTGTFETGMSFRLALHQDQVVALFSKLQGLLKLNENADLVTLELCLTSYVQLYPHQGPVGELSKELLGALLKRSEPSSLRLAQLLVQIDPDSTPQLREWASTASAPVAFPLLWAALEAQLGCVEDNLLIEMWNKLKDEVLGAIKKPKKMKGWLQNNFSAVLFLVKNFIDSEDVKEIVNRLQKGKINVSSMIHAQLVVQVCKSGLEFGALSMWLVQSITTALHDENKIELVTQLSSELQSCLQVEEKKKISACLKDNDILLEFCKLSLKHGVGGNHQLLETLADVLSVVKKFSHFEITWDMLLSHSQFLPTLLGSKQNLKYGVLRLLISLTLQQPSLMNAKHLPLLLGAYQASLSSSDQLILKMLRQYEAHGVNLHNLKPLVWGEAAVSRYALRSQSQTGLTLWNQPSSKQVLGLLDEKRIQATLARFPLDRGLYDDCELPSDAEVYDPAFILPLLSQLLAPESPVQAWLVTRHALGLCLMALASNKPDMRIAAQLVISRLYFHLEAARMTLEKSLWLKFLNTLRLSLQSSEEDNPKMLSPLLGLFLARASQEISNPKSPLYLQLNRFMMAKQSIDTGSVPELLRLLHSAEPQHSAHQLWILGILKDGIRTETDFSMFCSSFTYKLLCCLYKSPVSDTKTKVEVLLILQNVVLVPQAAWRLCTSNGLLSWLQGAAVSQPSHRVSAEDPSLLITAFVTLIGNIWQAAAKHTKSESKEMGFTHEVASSLTSTLLLLLPKLPTTSVILLPYLETLLNICKTCSQVLPLLSESHLNHMLQLVRISGVCNLANCEDIMNFGCAILLKQNNEPKDFVYINIRQILILWKSSQCSKMIQ